MKNHIIVARYNENIDWINIINTNLYDIYIYNKGEKLTLNNTNNIKIIDLDNIGREAHTYLYHIINNYNNLPEKIIFTQGHPFDHVKKSFITEINNNNIIEDFYYFSNNRLKLKFNEDATILNENGILNNFNWNNNHSGDSCIINIPLNIFPNKVFNNFEWFFNTGAIFCVSKKYILKNNIDFYNNIMNFFINSNDPINSPEAHSLERIWELIFT